MSEGVELISEAADSQTPELRARILAAVGKRLGLSPGHLAATIFGTDTPGNRRRVKVLTGEADD